MGVRGHGELQRRSLLSVRRRWKSWFEIYGDLVTFLLKNVNSGFGVALQESVSLEDEVVVLQMILVDTFSKSSSYLLDEQIGIFSSAGVDEVMAQNVEAIKADGAHDGNDFGAIALT